MPIHFVDFEGSLGSGVLEYGVVTLQGSEIADVTGRLCRASGSIRPEDTDVHGLTAGTVADFAPFADDFAVFAQLRENGPLAAHFAGVENSLLKATWPYPRTSPDFAGMVRPNAISEWGPWVDTGRLYPQLYPSLTSVRLHDLITRFALQEKLDAEALRYCPPTRRHYHAALYDALAGALLLARLAEEPALAERSTGWMLMSSTLDPDRREALNQGTLF